MLFGTTDSTRKAYAADHYVVPAMNEMVLDVYVDRDCGEEKDECVLIEPVPQAVDTLKLVMASCLVNVADNTTVKVKVMNTYSEPMPIKQDTVLGSVQPYRDETPVLLKTEVMRDVAQVRMPTQLDSHIHQKVSQVRQPPVGVGADTAESYAESDTRCCKQIVLHLLYFIFVTLLYTEVKRLVGFLDPRRLVFLLPGNLTPCVSPLTEGRGKQQLKFSKKVNIENHAADGRTIPKLIGDNCAGITKKGIENMGKVLDGGWHKAQTRSTTKAQPVIASNTEAKAPTSKKAKPKTTIGSISCYSMKTLKQKEVADSDIGPVLKFMEEGRRPFGAVVYATSPATRHYRNCWGLLEVRDGVLFRKYSKRNDTGHHLQFIVAKVMREEIMQQMHASRLAAHLGKKKTARRLLKRYYWFEL